MTTKVVRNLYSPLFRRPFVDEKVDPKTGEVKRNKGRTKQADKDSCDINKILARYEKTGMLPDMIRQDARYGDFSAVPDFLESFEIVAKAQEQFQALSASVRHQFNNDPAQMLAFVADPKNADKLEELGLATKTVASSSTPPLSGNSGAPSAPEEPAK